MSDDFAAAASRMYPTHGPAPAPAPSATPAGEARQPAAAEPAASPAPDGAQPATPREPWSRWGEQPPALPTQPDGVPPEPPAIEGAARLYAAPIRAEEVQRIMDVPADEAEADAMGFRVDDAARTERREAAGAMAEAQLSSAEAAAAWAWGQRAAHPSYQPPTREAGEAALRKAWGADYAKNLATAQAFMRPLYERSPAIKAHVLGTGLANDPGYVMAVFRAAQRRAR
ncbi:hypothetical protein [Roseomonas sp. CECT 9278]|uniref:hypothetical protein n=1 Tax=Roseomonas sp. CECT 9278 TaxID=2845823 RepID=UPI001E35B1EE|nr:hypothetical protein [Roseomonas sp. CECT 9278]CAH0161968.1 hypothetical protein ROS9278_00983 [Roseomonas sp. CECT 9278]